MQNRKCIVFDRENVKPGIRIVHRPEVPEAARKLQPNDRGIECWHGLFKTPQGRHIRNTNIAQQPRDTKLCVREFCCRPSSRNSGWCLPLELPAQVPRFDRGHHPMVPQL